MTRTYFAHETEKNADGERRGGRTHGEEGRTTPLQKSVRGRHPHGYTRDRQLGGVGETHTRQERMTGEGKDDQRHDMYRDGQGQNQGQRGQEETKE